MTIDDLTNAAERRRWNDAYWVSVWPRREQLTGAVTGLLLDCARPAPGERVVDVGSGAGIVSIATSVLVGATGSVTGADISRPLTEYASQRVAALGLGNVRFVVADVQQQPIEDAPFDLAVSQFGVLFFDDPIAAFANIRAQLQPRGRLAFACWQPIERNRWHLNHALGPYLPAPPPLESGSIRPGPFSLGDVDRTAGILARAGWQSLERSPAELNVVVERDALFDEGQLAFLGIPDEHLVEAARDVERHLAQFEVGDGRYEVGLSVQLFTATA